MYSELDIHTETICDQLMFYFIEHAKSLDDPEPTIEYIEGADHPTSKIVATNHDGRKFLVTITTEEID